MSTFSITTSNWNDASFWSAISVTGSGNTLDFSALPASFSVSIDDLFGALTVSDGTTTFVVKDSASPVAADATLGGGSLVSHFTTVTGSDGNDLLRGTSGADNLNGTTGSDTILGGDGNDTVFGGSGNDTLQGGDGDDALQGGAEDDSVVGGIGNDTLWGGSTGNDTVQGGDGADLIWGVEGRDVLEGDAGDDTIYSGSGDDVISGGDDADSIVFEDGYIGSDTITGGEGGADSDVLDFGAVSAAVTVTYSGVEAGTVTDGTDTVSFSEIERIITGDQGDVIDASGNAAAWGGSGFAIDAQGGDDTITGGLGRDSILGGDGDDLIIDSAGNDTVRGGAGNDTIGSDLSHHLDVFYGDAGNDDIFIGNGGDTAYGGDDADIIRSQGSGADKTAFGGEGGTDDDTISWAGESDAADTVSVVFTGDEAGLATIRGRTVDFSEFENVEGTQGGDVIDAGAATAGTDLSGQGGDDTLTGGSGADTLSGGDGADVINAGDGADLINAGDGADTLAGGLGIDTLIGGAGGDSLAGGSDGDLLFGDFAGIRFNETGFNGAGIAANIADFPATELSYEITFSSTQDTSDWIPLASYATPEASSGNEFVLVVTNGSVQLLFESNSLVDTGVDATGLFDGGVHTLALTWDSATGSLEIYTDGTSAYSGTHFTGKDLEPDGTFVLGQEQDSVGGGFSGGQSFDGTIYGVRLYDDVRTSAEIEASSLAPVADTGDPNLIANWIADPATGGFTDTNGSHPMTMSGDTAATLVAGDDTLLGGSGDDALFGGGGADRLHGDEGADRIEGGAGNDTLLGDARALDVPNSSFEDHVHGEGGYSTGAPGWTFTGAAGDWNPLATQFAPGEIDGDNVAYVNTGMSAQTTLSEAYDSSQTYDLYIDLGNRFGYGDQDFTINIYAGSKVISTYSGTTPSTGGTLETIILSTRGTETPALDGEALSIEIVNDGAHQINFDNVRMTAEPADGSAAGDDSLRGGDGADLVSGGFGADALSGDAGDDTIIGGAGEDTISGGSGSDLIDGGAGDDLLRSGSGNDTLIGGEGADTLMNSAGDDSLVGGAGDDLIVATAGRDTLEGGNGNDTLMGGTDGDSLAGGTGNDLLLGDLAGVRFNESGTTGLGQATGVGDFPATQLTYEVTFASTDAATVSALGSYSSADAQGNDFLVYSDGSTIRVMVNGTTNGSADTGISSASLFDGGVHTLAVTWDSGSGALQVFVDGTSAYTGTHFSGDSIASGGFLGLGQDQNAGGGIYPSHNFDGTIYGARLYDDVRTPSEIEGSSLGPVADLSDPNLVGNWVADPATGGFTDQTGSHPMAMSGDASLTWSSGDDTLLGGTGDDTIFGGGGADSIVGDPGSYADLVTNGTFSDASGWTVSNGGLIDSKGLGIGGNSGIGGNADGSASQSVVTEAGQDYTLSFDYEFRSLSASTPGIGSLEVMLDGVVVQTIDSGSSADGNTISFTATGASTTLEFRYVDNPGSSQSGSVSIDNVSIHVAHGDDVIDGGAGDDTLVGGAGDDTIQGGDGSDHLIFEDGFGSDVIVGGEGGTDMDVLDLSALTTGVTVSYTGDEAGTITDGTDTITFSEIEQIILGDQADLVSEPNPSAAPMTIDAGGGDDTIEGTSAGDSIVGGTGDDYLDGEGGDDTLVGGQGNDSLFADGGNDSLSGGDDDDELYAGTGSNTLDGGAGNDFLEVDGDDGAATVDGGTGIDTLDFDNDVDGVTVSYTGDGAGTFVGDEGASGTFTGIEEITGTAYGDAIDALLDTAGATFDVGSGDDTILAGSGDDRVEADGGADSVSAGAGADTVLGGTGNDTILGGEGADSLSGGDDADTFVVEDSFGNDTITGGEGGTDDDVIDLSALTTGVTVDYTGAEAGTITDGTDTLSFLEIERIILGDQADVVDASGQSGTTGIDVITGNGDDTITGGNNADTIDAGDGDDQITAGSGADSVRGGDGADTIVGDGGTDTIDGGDGADSIDGGGSADLLDGGQGDDTVLGGGGRDTIDGGDDNDSLDGGTGDDLITGGDGDDTFVYNVGDGADTITDFNSGNSGALGDGDTTNNDFIDLGAYYTNLSELRSDFDDDGVLNQSAGDYSDNTALAANDALTFQGADRGSFTADNTGVVCFRAGTRIATDHGDVAVETLRPGDLVVTADRGLQPVRWIGESVVPGFGQTAPIRIGAGALGRDLPRRDLWVSPQHRVLVRSKIVARMTGRDEALVPAVKLVGLPAITQEETADTIRYVHFMCDRHEVVFANGTPSETLFPGPMAQAMMTPETWHELSLIRPQAIEPARSIVDGKRGVRLATRHRKNRHALVCVD